MAQLSVEDASSERWRQYWLRTGREPFAHPAYMSLTLEATERAVAMCWSDGAGEVLLPLRLRPLPDEAWTRSVASRHWIDAISPYGYGGPFVAGMPDLAAFFSDLLAWMRDDRVLTGFVRASLGAALPNTGVGTGYEAVRLADNVVVDVTRTPGDQWRHYEHKVRKNVNKARRHELRVEIRDQFNDVTDFVRVYHDTMRRRSASEEYWLGTAYFEGLRDAMPDCYWVADVIDTEDRVVSTELVLTGEQYCYSFLGGTLEDAFSMAPNDLLKHELIEHASAHGLSGYVLGGGYRSGDGIFRYKRGFDPTGIVPFYGLRLTAEAGVYNELSSARPGSDPGSFFPAYRAS